MQNMKGPLLSFMELDIETPSAGGNQPESTWVIISPIMLSGVGELILHHSRIAVSLAIVYWWSAIKMAIIDDILSVFSLFLKCNKIQTHCNIKLSRIIHSRQQIC